MENEPSVYAVPHIVADNLEEYCVKFCKIIGSKSFNETDFIKHLGKLFPDNPPKFIETLTGASYHFKNKKKIYTNVPEIYQSCEWFNF